MFNNKPLICTACGYVGKPQRITKGNTLIELILWLCFLLPGLIYSIWRLSSKYDACPKCKGASMIPTDSPVGQKVINEQKNTLGTDPVETYKTESQKETAKNTKLATIVIGSVIVMISISAYIGQNNAKNEPQNTTAQPVVQTSQPTFDVPALLGKNIDEIRKILGKPTGKNIEAPKDILDKQKLLGGSYVMQTWDNTFESNGLGINVEFYIKNRSVKEFFIEANDPSGVTKDKQRLLLIGNLNEKDPRYSVEFVKAKVDPTSFTGITISPK